MQITLFGVVWIIILLIACIRGMKTLTKCVIFSAVLQADVVCYIGNWMVAPLGLGCLLYIALYAFKNLRCKLALPSFIKAGLLFWLVIFVFSAISASAFRGVQYMNTSNALTYSRYSGEFHWGILFLLVYIIAGWCMCNAAPLTEKEVHRLLSFCVWFVAAVGIWQVLTVQGLLPRVELLEQLIYSRSRSADSMAYYTGLKYNVQFVRFHSSFMEPSHSAGFLAMSFYYFISRERLTMADKTAVAAILAMTVLSFSATAYPSVAIAGILALVTTDRQKLAFKILWRGILLIVIALIVVNAAGLWSSVVSWILEKGSSGSAYIRGSWNASALQVFRDTKGLGLGYGTTNGSSLLYTLLESIGLPGSIAYLSFIVSLAFYAKRYKIDKRYAMMVLSITAAQMIAMGALDYTILWSGFLLYCTVGHRPQAVLSRQYARKVEVI